jgi:hypothetical protein
VQHKQVTKTFLWCLVQPQINHTFASYAMYTYLYFTKTGSKSKRNYKENSKKDADHGDNTNNKNDDGT